MAELEKGIIPRVVGGLGNQMFIVSAAYAAHRYSNSPLYILQNPLENNPHNRKKQNYNDTVFKFFGKHLPYYQEDPLFQDYVRVDLPYGFAPWLPQTILPGTLMVSYYQFYPALEPFEDELRELFLKGLEPFLKNYEDCAFLHIRRGDYLKNPDYHYLQTIEYYKNAVSNLLERQPNIRKIYVVSDDMDWVNDQGFFLKPIFEVYTGDNEVETLALMASCKGGAICGNSTFSWWGAFLGAYARRSPVIVPKRWIGTYVASLFPVGWSILE